MNIKYKKALLTDLDLLSSLRVTVLRAANQLSPATELPDIYAAARRYYRAALSDGTHTSFFALDGEITAGVGGVSYFTVMPTLHNPTGQKAYIMNMYTAPAYRRQGIALHLLDLLVADAKSRGVTHISLEATDMGRPLYTKYGFIPMASEMELPIPEITL